jgi:iron(III) transport system ATP-binding protein
MTEPLPPGPRGLATALLPTGPSAEANVMVALDELGAVFGRVVALDAVTLSVRAGEVMALLGPSGSGKSTLLRIVAGVERPTCGRVRIDGREVAGPGVFVEPEARHVGMVFQDYALFPHLTVAANVAFGLKGRDRAGHAVTVHLLDRLGLARYASSYPHMLSGGERQRVALARALAPSPRVLLMDEPFSGLDGRLRDRVRQETLDLLRETGTTTLIVTHDPSEAMCLADRIALLREGRLQQCGTAEELYARPANAFTARFLSEVNELAGTCQRGHVETPLGSFAAPHVAEQMPARVCIRPQHVHLATAPTDICGRVVASEFLGDADRVTVDVRGCGSPMALRVPGRARLSPGDTVFLQVDASHAVVFPDDGRS